MTFIFDKSANCDWQILKFDKMTNCSSDSVLDTIIDNHKFDKSQRFHWIVTLKLISIIYGSVRINKIAIDDCVT